jgi:hypothetical protein
VPKPLKKVPVRVRVLYSSRSAAMRLPPLVNTTLPVAIITLVSWKISTWSADIDSLPQSISTCPVSLM